MAELAVCRPHANDGRRVVIEATDEGRAAEKDLRQEIHDLRAEFLKPLSPDELAQLHDMLRRCLAAQEKLRGTRSPQVRDAASATHDRTPVVNVTRW